MYFWSSLKKVWPPHFVHKSPILKFLLGKIMAVNDGNSSYFRILFQWIPFKYGLKQLKSQNPQRSELIIFFIHAVFKNEIKHTYKRGGFEPLRNHKKDPQISHWFFLWEFEVNIPSFVNSLWNKVSNCACYFKLDWNHWILKSPKIWIDQLLPFLTSPVLKSAETGSLEPPRNHDKR